MTWHAEGQIAEVKTAVGTDYVYLAQDGEAKATHGISFKGKAGAVLQHNKYQVLATGTAGKVVKGKVSLEVNKGFIKEVLISHKGTKSQRNF